MDLVLFLALLAVIARWVSAPLRRVTAPAPEPTAEALEREARLVAIRDAELDARMGKLSAAEHRDLDAVLRAEALEALRE
jgi:Na+-transporting methylmalonyl-CoA/oxaloacetate decarboxylase gamma subunit